jgi:hypothetical protein
MKRTLVVLTLLILCGCSGPTEKSGPTTVQIPVKPPDDAAAVQLLRKINTAQAAYLQRNRRYALTYDELTEAHLLTSDPSKSADGYEIILHPAPDAESYTVVAAPVSPSAQTKSFYTDKTGIIRSEQGREANSSSQPVQ